MIYEKTMDQLSKLIKWYFKYAIKNSFGSCAELLLQWHSGDRTGVWEVMLISSTWNVALR